MKLNGARLLADCLVKQGVEYIFGIPGAKIDALFDALIDTPIKVILCRHEQNAAFIAAAYGRLTGKPGVVLVTSGPGVSNLITGLLTATTEGDPVVAMGGNVPRSMRLKESHQSTDNIRLTEGATKASMEVMMAENIPEVVENAFRIAATPRSGAVFISIPQDVLIEIANVSIVHLAPPIAFGPAPRDLIERAARLLSEAKNPVLLLGLEASRPENTQAVRALLEKTRIAAVGTYQAAGVVSRDLLDCFVGRVGLFKNQPGDRLIDAADVVVTIGFSSVEYDPEVWNADGKTQIIHLDYKMADIHSTYVPSLEILGDIASNLTALSSLLNPKQELAQVKFIKELQTELKEKIASGARLSGEIIHPLRFIHDLREAIDDETTVISDIGTHYMWLARYFFSYQPHHLLFSNGQQTLGVALPWAMAARIVRPGKKVISISGDGGFLFSAMELETAVREKMPFVHCVWCDNAYDMVLEQQVLKYRRETAVRFGHVDIVQFAASFGAQGVRVNHSDELLPALKEAFSQDGPVLLEIPIDYADNLELFKSVKDNVGN